MAHQYADCITKKPRRQPRGKKIAARCLQRAPLPIRRLQGARWRALAMGARVFSGALLMSHHRKSGDQMPAWRFIARFCLVPFRPAGSSSFF